MINERLEEIKLDNFSKAVRWLDDALNKEKWKLIIRRIKVSKERENGK